MNKINYEQQLMDAIAPFVENYKKYPHGFAETNNLNDIDECQKDVNELLSDFNLLMSTAEKKAVIAREINRWNNGKNAGGFGRYIARLEYLKTK